jgi:hypothetical protein
MAANFSWGDSAGGYSQLYEQALIRARTHGG